MSRIPGRAIHGQATATIHSGSGGICQGVRLVGGADAAVITVREGGASGTILFTMKAGIAGVDEMAIPFGFKSALHVTLNSGTTPDITFFM